MSILVQKFGGTSVADPDRIHLAARRAVRAILSGRQVVIVVSAMGHATDELLKLARRVSRNPPRRELDMLLATGEQVSIALMAMALHEAGYDAVSLTGAQVGLRTDAAHTHARIQTVDAGRIRRDLAASRVVIVAGFQGVDPQDNITTLGRGGSDTTAVALAAALSAEVCEIYTDVDGVYTADPRLAPDARKLDRISYDEMLELASLGAGVMHGRSIELGKKFRVPIRVRSCFSENDGTMICDDTGMEGVVFRGCTLKRDLIRIALNGLPNRPGAHAEVFDAVAAHGVMVDDIMQTVAPGGALLNLGFTVEGATLGEMRALGELLAQRLGVSQLDVRDGLARISVVGVGMRSHRGVAARMFAALGRAGVSIENISTSEIVISALTPDADAERALRAVHAEFSSPPDAAPGRGP